jgi:diguanylate cyclase (GGDEF)-like protein
VRFVDGAYRVSRAQPAAPLTVNGRPVQEEALRHGDLLALGELTLLFSAEPAPAPPGAPTVWAETPDSTVHSRVKPPADAEASVSVLRRGRRAVEQLEALYRVSAAIGSTLELSELVDQLLAHLFAAFNPDRCFILLYDGQGRLAIRGERISERSRKLGSVKISRTILNEAVDRREAILTRSALQDARFATGQSVLDQNLQSAMCSPVAKNDRILGALYVDTIAGPGAFDEDDLTLLGAIGRQAAVAIENVEAHERERAYGRALARLEESARRLSASLSQDWILEQAVARSCEIFECTKASVLLLDAERARLTVAASNCIDRTLWASIRIRPGEGYAGKAFAEGRALRVSDAPGTAGRAYETASFVIAPLLAGAEGVGPSARPIGVLSVTDKVSKGPFTPLDQELLSIFAAQAGVALHNARLYERATVDTLTRLYNRQYFAFRIEEDVRTHLETGAPLSVVMADLDHFKDKNDVYGHPAGDRILAEAAEIVRRIVGSAGFAARYGGEEFAAVLPGVALDRAHELAKDIRLEIEEKPFNAGDEPLHCTISIGAAALKPGEPAEAFVKRADAALYMAKRSGRNRVELAK